MKLTGLLAAVAALLFMAAPVHAQEGYSAAEDYLCGGQHADNWSYLAYRASDGDYRQLAYGRVQVTEISRYGADAFYLPDGDQDLRPFFTKLGKKLFCSPAYEGERYDAAIVWSASEPGEYSVSGLATLIGKVGGGKPDGTVTVRILADDNEIWSGEVGGDAPVGFGKSVEVPEGGKICLRVENGSGEGPKVTEIELDIKSVE